MMSGSLAAFLTAQDADSVTIQYAVRYLVAEWAEDPSVEEMRSTLAEAALDVSNLQSALGQLEGDSSLLEAADLAVLEAAWEDSELIAAVEGAIRDAKAKLPVIEVSVIALVAMYGLYLAATGGRKSVVRSVVRRADGTYEEIEQTEWYGPTAPLSAMAGLFGASGSAKTDEA